jgi:FkbM family methyltransferase
MRRRKIFAARLAGTLPHRLLRRTSRALGKYLDRIENWGNCDPATNGEYFLIEQAAPTLRLVLDIGANLGDWTARVALVAPTCLVHAFEASPRTFANLSRRLTGTPNLVLHQAGMGERAGREVFQDCGENSGLSSFVSRAATIGLKAEREVEVPVTTVDDFCRQHQIARLDFVKIDTEGFEGPILRGMVDSLRHKRVIAVQFEYGGTWLDAGESLAGVSSLLVAHGYALHRLRPDGVEPLRYNSQVHESFKYANYLAVQSPAVLAQWGVRLCPS